MLLVNLAMDNTNYNMAVWLCTLLAAHPLHNMVWQAADELSGSNLPSHPSPLHHLLRLTGLNQDNIKTISPPTRQPHRPFRLQMPIAASQENTLWEDTALHCFREADLLLYTDSSSYKGRISGTAVMLKWGCPLGALRKHIRPATEHIMYEGEASRAHLIGEELRLWIAAMEISLSLDNTTFIKVLHAWGARSGKHLVDGFIIMMDQLSTDFSVIRYTLTIRWIPGHSSADGNKLADEEAKWAAEGNSSDIMELPVYLRGTMPGSASVL